MWTCSVLRSSGCSATTAPLPDQWDWEYWLTGEILHRGREISEWTSDAGGEIVTKVTGAELYRDLHLTAASEIEIALGWKGKPGFMISFAGPDDVRLSKQVVKLETWDNDLVLQTLSVNGNFEVIQSIPADAESLELRLQWNPLNGELSVYTLTGQFLGKMHGDPLPSDQLSGLYIQNRGAVLTLTRLRANGWEGAGGGQALPAGTARLRLSDGSAVAGQVIAYDAQESIVAGDAQRWSGSAAFRLTSWTVWIWETRCRANEASGRCESRIATARRSVAR